MPLQNLPLRALGSHQHPVTTSIQINLLAILSVNPSGENILGFFFFRL